MGLATGVRNLTFDVNLANVTVPTVLVAGGRDRNSEQAVSEDAFKPITRADKLFVAIPNATHRSSTRPTAQLQSAAAHAQAIRADGMVWNPVAAIWEPPANCH